MNNNGLSNPEGTEFLENPGQAEDELENLFNDISGALNDKGKLNKLLKAPETPNKPGRQRSETGVITEVVDEDEGLVGRDGRVKADTEQENSEDTDEDEIEPVADKDETPPAEDKDDPESEKEQTDGEPANKAVSDKTRKPSAIKEAKKYLDSLPQDARKAVSNLMKEADKARKDAGNFKHQYESQQGRMAAIQRDVADLRTQLTLRGEPSRPPANSGAAAITPPGSSKAPPAPRITESARFKRLQEVDPEMAELLVEALSEQAKTVMQEADAKIESVRVSAYQAEQQRYVSRQREIVREALPSVELITKTPEFQEFYTTSSPHVKALAESIHSEDSFAALQLYANWLRNNHPHFVEGKQQAAKPVAKTAADKVLEDRANRLKVAGSAAVPTSRPVPPEKEPEDEDELFKYWEKKLASK